MLINIIGIIAILSAVAGAVAYLVKKHQMAKKTGGHACVGCSCGCGCVGSSKCGSDNCGVN